jgi:hypothetical protein
MCGFLKIEKIRGWESTSSKQKRNRKNQWRNWDKVYKSTGWERTEALGCGEWHHARLAHPSFSSNQSGFRATSREVWCIQRLLTERHRGSEDTQFPRTEV